MASLSPTLDINTTQTVVDGVQPGQAWAPPRYTTSLVDTVRVNVKINVYANEYEGVKRINATLEVVQFVRDDEPFGAAPATADDMPDVEEDDLDDDLDAPPAKGKGKGKAAAADDDDDDL